ncbi:MAG: CmpA/NrtA family ABC transporter substrate-binding protein [Lautropia sp.]|nr:CmpA/NrtA family ABC transporter substrate-binding protein [Lautropia sp.]
MADETVDFSPYDADRPLRFSCRCGQHAWGVSAERPPCDMGWDMGSDARLQAGAETRAGALVEASLVKALFPHDGLRRRFLRAVGAPTAMAAIASVVPVASLQAMVHERAEPERRDLNIGFLPITCATPLIMAEVNGHYQEEGLNVRLLKNAAFGLVRDRLISGELDGGLMLATMPLAASMGLGSPPTPLRVAMIENVNGIALVMALKHRHNRDPRNWRGMTFAIPLEYSVQNLMLRYYLANAGLDPDRDVQIRVVVPTEFVSNLRAGNIDGFVGADPLNQRAIFEEAGFFQLHMSQLWPGHPCCSFSVAERFITRHPNAFAAMLRAALKGSAYSRGGTHRREIARELARPHYLNQPEIVVRQALVGRFADGLGNVVEMPERVEFNPIPWESMAIWMLTQLKRWGYVKAEVDYAALARQVFLMTDAERAMKALGQPWPSTPYERFEVMGEPFDARDPTGYLQRISRRGGAR